MKKGMDNPSVLLQFPRPGCREIRRIEVPPLPFDRNRKER